MSVKIEFETDNAAFSENNAERVRILHELADLAADDHDKHTIRDTNGNPIGKMTVSA